MNSIHKCEKHDISKVRKHNSTIYVCPRCEYENILKKRSDFSDSRFTSRKDTCAIKRKSPRQCAMDRADEWFSRYIRLKYAKLYSGELICHCYTCGKPHGIKQIENGHWQRRGYKTTRFNVNNARPQCTQCNHFYQGKPEIFRIKLIEEIGIEAVTELEQSAQEQGADNESFYREQANLYRTKFNKLLKQLNIQSPWR